MLKLLLFSTLFVFCNFISHNHGETVSYELGSDITWTNELNLGSEFLVKWNRLDPEWLVMEISAPTKGYVSIGFSPNGGMKGSDIFMGWVDSAGNAYHKDLYAVDNTMPLEDDTNNYELLGALQTDSRTAIRFRRPWNTCDRKHDLEITEDTIRLIWAYGEYDPTTWNNQEFKPAYHGPDFRGGRSVFLKIQTHLSRFPDDEYFPDNQVKHWDIKVDRIQVPTEDTYYFCKVIKVPPTPRKHQIIGFRPILEEANKKNVVRINLFECSVSPSHGSSANIFDKYITHPGGECYTKNMPPEWAEYCITVPFVWVTGAEGLMLEESTGIPLGEEHNGPTYFMLEIHYDNPKKLSFEDSSGLRLFISDKLREYDSGSITMMTRYGQLQLIPPRAPSFTDMAFCSSECTQKSLPQDGITVTHATLHAHLAAKAIIIRHIRDGVELKPIAEDRHFDFNYQQTRIVSPPRKVLPGDIVITECEYDTSERETITYGGTSSRDEMCQGYIQYYPKVNLAVCRTQHEFKNFFNAIGVNKVVGQDALDKVQLPYKPIENQLYDPGDDAYLLRSHANGPAHLFDLIRVADPNFGYNLTVTEYVNSLKWTENDGDLTKKVWKQWWNGEHYSLCSEGGFRRVPLKDYLVYYPKFKSYVPPVEAKCMLSGGETVRVASTLLAVILIFRLAFQVL